MAICLSHKSAARMLECIAQAGDRSINELEPASGSCLDRMTANAHEAHELLGEELSSLKPLDLMVGRPSLRHVSEDVNAHLWNGYIPDDAIKKYKDGLYVVSPEFCLLQQARELHTVNLCQLLGQFLATRSPKDGMRNSKLIERSPLTSMTRLDEFVRDARKAYGIARLQEAMRYTLPGAASPQETNLQLVFALPYTYYGFGFKGLELNHQVDLTTASKGLCDGESIYVDLYFGKPHPYKGEDVDALRAFGLEYQGEEFHQDPSRDVARFLAAHVEKVDLWFVAHQQLESALAIDCIAREAARRMRRRVYPGSWPSIKQLEVLLGILNGKRIPKQDECQRKRLSKARQRA